MNPDWVLNKDWHGKSGAEAYKDPKEEKHVEEERPCDEGSPTAEENARNDEETIEREHAYDEYQPQDALEPMYEEEVCSCVEPDNDAKTSIETKASGELKSNDDPKPNAPCPSPWVPPHLRASELYWKRSVSTATKEASPSDEEKPSSSPVTGPTNITSDDETKSIGSCGSNLNPKAAMFSPKPCGSPNLNPEAAVFSPKASSSPVLNPEADVFTPSAFSSPVLNPTAASFTPNIVDFKTLKALEILSKGDYCGKMEESKVKEPLSPSLEDTTSSPLNGPLEPCEDSRGPSGGPIETFSIMKPYPAPAQNDEPSLGPCTSPPEPSSGPIETSSMANSYPASAQIDEQGQSLAESSSSLVVKPKSYADALKVDLPRTMAIKPTLSLVEDFETCLNEMLKDGKDQTALESFREYLQSQLPAHMQHIERPIYYRERMAAEEAKATRVELGRKIQTGFAGSRDPLMGFADHPDVDENTRADIEVSQSLLDRGEDCPLPEDQQVFGATLEQQYDERLRSLKQSIKDMYQIKFDQENLEVTIVGPRETLQQQLAENELSMLFARVKAKARDPSEAGWSCDMAVPASRVTKWFAEGAPANVTRGESNFFVCSHSVLILLTIH